jgi:prophage antirepressor-like protein
MKTKLIVEKNFEDLYLDVYQDKEHEWLLESYLVARGYEVKANIISNHKKRNQSELIEGIHWLSSQIVKSGQKRNVIFWTKRGVIRLGFFIKSARAKLFRDWVEDLIIRELVFNSNNFITI